MIIIACLYEVFIINVFISNWNFKKRHARISFELLCITYVLNIHCKCVFMYCCVGDQ
jgi:hypothetical protein